MNELLQRTRRIVLKFGTGILTSGIGKLDTQRINGFAAEVARLRERGLEPIVVSSGAVGLGMGKMGFKKRPADLATLQMCAAIGQSILIDTWQAAFDPHGLTVAQALLTREDLRARNRHVAVKDLFEKLLAHGVVPIVNGNDSVSTEGIKFSDNDLLAAYTASFTKAQMLVILSTAPGLIDRMGSGKIVPVVEKITPEIAAMAQGTTDATAVGGMTTKIDAARVANQSNCGVFITSGKDPAVISRMFAGTAQGTYFVPGKLSMASRKRWVAFFHPVKDAVCVDAGAAQALREQRASLLAKGVTGVEGDFEAGDIVQILDPEGQAVGRGLVRYSSTQVKAIAGMRSPEIQKKFPRRKRLEVINRDELVLL